MPPFTIKIEGISFFDEEIGDTTLAVGEYVERRVSMERMLELQNGLSQLFGERLARTMAKYNDRKGDSE